MFYIDTNTVGVHLFYPIACVANSNFRVSKTSKTAIEIDYKKILCCKMKYETDRI